MKRYIKSAITNVVDLPFDDRIDLAQDPTTSPEVLYELYDKADYLNINHAIAANPNTPIDLLNTIANSDNFELHKSLVFNENLPKDILDKLANDDNYGIQYRVAEHHNTSPRTLRKLVTHTASYDILKNVVMNPNVTESIILAALKKDSGLVGVILDNPNISDEFKRNLIHNSVSWVRVSLAKTTDNPDFLIQLAQDSDYYVRSAVANNWDTPVDVLKELMSDSEWLVRKSANETYAFRVRMGRI